jgi:CBS domain-containing protein
MAMKLAFAPRPADSFYSGRKDRERVTSSRSFFLPDSPGEEATRMFRHVLVVIDESESSYRAAEAAIEVASIMHANLDILAIEVVPSDSVKAGEEGRESGANFHQRLLSMCEQAELQGVQARSAILSGQSEAEVILAYIKGHQGDLLVLGATEHDFSWPPALRETARRLAQEAPCAVMLVRSSAFQRRVRDIMKIRVARVVKVTPLSEVVRILIEEGVKLLPVVNDEQRVPGVITLGHLLTHDQAFRRLDLRQVTSTEHLGHYVRQLFATAKTAGDVMQRHPLVMRDDATLEAAAQQMMSRHVTRAPVVNGAGTLVGLLDQADILRSVTDLPKTSEAQPQEEALLPVGHLRAVGEAVLSPVPLVALQTPLTEVLQTVQETALRRVIVIDEQGKAMGVIADLDILASRGLSVRRNPLLALADRFQLRIPEELFRRRSSPLTAREVMRPRLFSVTPATPIAEAIHLMLAERIKRLVVVDDEGKPLGMVNREQLLHVLLEAGV